MRLPVALAAIAIVATTSAPMVQADAGCAHRGGAHVARHGGQLEDDRFHLLRGELVTCSGDEKNDNQDWPDENEPNMPAAHEVKPHAPRGGDDGQDSNRHHLGHDTHRWWRND